MRLGHLHLRGPISYHRAAQLQEALLQRYFGAKDFQRAAKAKSAHDSSAPNSPDPTVITTEFHPVYTFGRRQLNTVSEDQRRFLQDNGKAMVVEARRGGQVTYHGPGQLVAYPVIDLRRQKITPRRYIRLLEETVMEVCASLGVPAVETTDDPGVWVKGGQRKICAVGVQIRMGVTSHGIGLNVTDRDNLLSWGFGRIVACGLEGKHVTCLSAEGARDAGRLNVDSVAPEFVKALATHLGTIGEVYQASEEDLQRQEYVLT
jgi:lipoyl(octanoyl) transferase 2